MKRNYMVICFLLFLFFPYIIKADDVILDSRCTIDMRTSLVGEANDIKYRISKDEIDNGITYNLYLYNVSNSFLVDNIITDTNTMVIENIGSGKVYTYDLIVKNHEFCNGFKAKTITINLPYYNEFHDHELCKGYENYYLCRDEIDKKITEAEFEKNMNDYISSLNNKNDGNENDGITNDVEDDNELNLFDIYNTYKYYLYIVIVLGIIVIGIIVYNKNKRRGIL